MQACDAVEGHSIYPREFGGRLGDTEILTWDYQSYNGRSRLALGGKTNSRDLVTHDKSGVLIYERGGYFTTLWTKEFYKT